MVDGSAGTRPSSRCACAWMRGEASAAESCDCSEAFDARRFVRCWFALSRSRFSRSTARFTKTTPARTTALITIQAIARCERARRWARLLDAGPGCVLGRARVRRGVATAAARGSAKLHRRAEPCGLRARVAGDLCGRRPDRATRRRAQRRARAARADRELGRARAPVLLVAQEALDDSVLQRVERDDRELAARPEHL